ncbi:DinB family protein [Paenibacillus cellulositrophicus]|uniref:DinB family protein n=1 Tax=Paenibacillus TaxID=44249 RepID=UPI000E2445F5|nr:MULTISPECIES: DinB family protein [Paenibacillus]KAF9121274.1 hypothetical protein BGX30_002684 [Mortierella sp. GBA39]MCM2995979.1 DinB family protein [Paenibacillus cellulositrophicus]RED36399.1 putative damage-inducible protein DinB [Paenibacillus sp. VMFN-D1]
MSEVQIDKFSGTHRQLLAAIEGLSEEQLTWKRAPEVWSVQEVLSHLTDHSIVTSFRIRDILAGTAAQLPAFEQDAWVSGQHANQGGTPDILDAFHALLTYNTLLLQRLTPEDLAKTGVNPRGQTVSVADLVNGFIRHVENHLGQIERIKQAAALV